MAHITRIKSKETPKEKPKKTPKEVEKPKKIDKKPFILVRPLVYFFRYLRDSWKEIRQVRWPSRKATWKLFFAIIIYTFIIGAIIMLLDVFFTWLFNLIIG